jgi:hypothetical protein
LEVIVTKKFPSERLTNVRDLFLFSCYTGLAYADVKKLRNDEIVIGVDGEQWIITHRIFALLAVFITWGYSVPPSKIIALLKIYLT